MYLVQARRRVQEYNDLNRALQLRAEGYSVDDMAAEGVVIVWKEEVFYLDEAGQLTPHLGEALRVRLKKEARQLAADVKAHEPNLFVSAIPVPKAQLKVRLKA